MTTAAPVYYDLTNPCRTCEAKPGEPCLSVSENPGEVRARPHVYGGRYQGSGDRLQGFMLALRWVQELVGECPSYDTASGFYCFNVHPDDQPNWCVYCRVQWERGLRVSRPVEDDE